MRKVNKAPLNLRGETIRHLSNDALRAVAGGKHITAQSTEPACQSVNVCPTSTCPGSGVLCPGPITPGPSVV